MVLNPQAVVELGVVPLLKVNHQVQLGLIFDRPEPKELPHVDDTDAPQFDVMPDDLRRGAHQPAGELAQLHRVVRHQAVAPHDQLNGHLALADSRVSSDHHTLTVNVQQHAVAGNAGSHYPVQKLDGLAGKVHSGLFGAQ